MNEPIEIVLTHPIPYGESTLSKLTLRRPKAGDFRALKGVDRPFAMIIDLAAVLSDQTPAILDRLDGEDMPKLVEVVGGFLGVFRAIGMT
jgi:hypothetical protein